MLGRESAVPGREAGPAGAGRGGGTWISPGTGSLKWGATPASQGYGRGGGRDQAPEMALGGDGGDNQECLDPGYFWTLSSISWWVRRRL